MRTSLCLAGVLLLVAGCSRTTSVPAPFDGVPAPGSSAVDTAPATIVLSGVTDGHRHLLAVSEQQVQRRSPALLSAPGSDAAFVVALPGHRALLFERGAGEAAPARFAVVNADGTGRVELGLLTAARYSGAAAAVLTGGSPSGSIVVEAVRAADARRDLLSLPIAAGAAPRLVAEDVALVAASADRAAFLQEGTLRSAKLDGSALVTLGGGDGLDQVVAVPGLRAERLLLTLHGAGHGDVRVVSVDGTVRVDFAQPGADEQAFALTAAGRALFTRTGAQGPALISAALDGSGERALTAPALGAAPRLLADTGLVLFESAAGALMSVDSAGGPVRTLDARAGTDLVVSHVTADRVIYTGVGELSPSLRVARLDGGGVTILCEKPLWLPYFSTLSDGGRVVFHRALAGQLEGGASYSVNLDGSDLGPIGTDITTVDGSHAPPPFDQDFMAVTPAGHLVLEAEYEGFLDSQLVLAAPGTPIAHELARLTGLLFAGLIP